MNNQPTAYQSIIAKAWTDADYKARLMREPRAVLQEAGVQIPDDVQVKVHADTDEVINMVLPASPAGEVLSAEELEQVAGGTFTINIAVCVYTYVAGCKTVGESCAP